MPARPVTIALSVIALLAVLYIGTLAFLWWFQERIVFQPPASRGVGESAGRGVGVSQVSYSSSDGLRLMGFVLGSRENGPIILAFHGNAVTAHQMIPWAEEVSRRLGATVVLPEYRGYDGVVGAPTYEGARLDAAAALAATTGRFHVRPENVFYYGHSLGSAVATELAADSPPRALILESPFTSARDMAGRMPVAGLTLFWKAISRVHYRTVERVSELDVPVYVAHGKRDMVVPARMGAAVYEAARKKGALLMVPEAGHNDVPLVGGDDYWRWLGKAVGSGAH